MLPSWQRVRVSGICIGDVKLLHFAWYLPRNALLVVYIQSRNCVWAEGTNFDQRNRLPCTTQMEKVKTPSHLPLLKKVSCIWPWDFTCIFKLLTFLVNLLSLSIPTLLQIGSDLENIDFQNGCFRPSAVTTIFTWTSIDVYTKWST